MADNIDNDSQSSSDILDFFISDISEVLYTEIANKIAAGTITAEMVEKTCQLAVDGSKKAFAATEEKRLSEDTSATPLSLSDFAGRIPDEDYKLWEMDVNDNSSDTTEEEAVIAIGARLMMETSNKPEVSADGKIKFTIKEPPVSVSKEDLPNILDSIFSEIDILLSEEKDPEAARKRALTIVSNSLADKTYDGWLLDMEAKDRHDNKAADHVLFYATSEEREKLELCSGKLSTFFTRDPGAPIWTAGFSQSDWEGEPPDVSWIIKDWLQEDSIGFLSGRGGLGKSHLAFQFCYSLASGEKYWLGRAGHGANMFIELADPRPVIFVTWEDSLGSLHRRLPETIWKKPFASIGDRLIAIGGGARGIWEPDPDKSGHIATIAGLSKFGKFLDDLAAERQPVLMVFDPLAAAYQSSENERSLVRKFMADRTTAAYDLGFTVMIVGHPAKVDDGSESSEYSGSTDWRNSSRSFWTLAAASPPNESDKKTPKYKIPVGIRLRRTKTNEGMKVPDVWLVRDAETFQWKAATILDAVGWYASSMALDGEKGSLPDTGLLVKEE